MLDSFASAVTLEACRALRTCGGGKGRARIHAHGGAKCLDGRLPKVVTPLHLSVGGCLSKKIKLMQNAEAGNVWHESLSLTGLSDESKLQRAG
eukprot:350500-Chlamydomonas_euryale.AAC.5